MLNTEERQQIKSIKEWVAHLRDMEKQAGGFTSKILKLTGMTQNPMTRMLDTIEWLIAIVDAKEQHMSEHLVARTKEISAVLRRIAKEVRVTAQGSSRTVMYELLASEVERQADEVELLGGGRTRKGLVNT